MKKTIMMLLILVLFMVAEPAKADFIFGTPTKVPNVNTSSREFNISVSADGLSLYFNSSRPGGIGGIDIWVATRETKDDPWGEPVNLGPPVNTPVNDWGPSISHDSLSLYFDISQSGTSSAVDDIWVATRDAIHGPWGTPENLGPM
ncbi:MAG: TolB-like translocation protein, partial [Planctomycetota bacterium]